MRSASLSLLIVFGLGCGGGQKLPEVRVSHIVVSLVPLGTGEDRVVRDYASKRTAAIVRGRSLDSDRAIILNELRRFDPEFVTVFVPADQFDSNFALAFQDIAAAIDPDIFTDFSYGFVPVIDTPLLQRWFKTIQIIDHRRETRLFQATTVELAGVSDEVAERLEWASGLPRKRIRLQAGDSGWLKEHIKDIQEADLLLVTGAGNCSGHHSGLSTREVDTLKVDNQVVFLGVPGSGIIGPYFGVVDGKTRRSKYPSQQCIALSFLRQGAMVLMAPLDDDGAGNARYEMDLAILSNRPLGSVMKSTYDCARIVRPLRDEPLPMKTEDRPLPTEYTRVPKILQALSRVLIGDPSIQPFVRSTRDPLKYDGEFEKMDASGNPQLVLRYVVDFPEAKHVFADPITDGDRIHIRHALPAGTKSASADLAGCELDGEMVTARLLGQALENWEGKLYLHAVVGSDAGKLARKGLKVTLNVRRS